jgi:hypothetical protein
MSGYPSAVFARRRPVLRFVGFLLMASVGAGGLLFIDYNSARQAAAAVDDRSELSFADYLGTIPDRVSSVTASATGNRLAMGLADMLPPPPEGWTQRATTKKDIDDFLPKKGVKSDKKARDQVSDVGSTKVVKGGEVVVQTYERGERRVTIQVIRYPDRFFTELDTAEQRFTLRKEAAERRGRPVMTLRGLDVTEEFLGDGIRARYFSAFVGAQIQIRVLATKRMKDDELLPFFQMLNVQAMNASVVDKVDGLGEVPVILLASAMKKAEREAYEADRIQRSEDALALARELRAADAEAATDPDSITKVAGKAVRPTAGFAADCAKGIGGIKRCSVPGSD